MALNETSSKGEITITLPMTPTITAFEQSPDRGRGLARDMRVRWALEEVGQPYAVRLVSFTAMKEPAHRALHPFGRGSLARIHTGAGTFRFAPAQNSRVESRVAATHMLDFGLG
jgi:hypothetical protein